MAETKEINLEVKSNLGGSIAELKALKRELKNASVGSDEFKKIFGQIDDLEDKIKSAKNASSDWVDTLENAGGPLGMVGAAINKAKVATQSFGAAFKAAGIGLVVSLVAGLAAAFSQNEGTMKKLQPLLIGFQKIFNGILFQLPLKSWIIIWSWSSATSGNISVVTPVPIYGAGNNWKQVSAARFHSAAIQSIDYI